MRFCDNRAATFGAGYGIDEEIAQTNLQCRVNMKLRLFYEHEPSE
jgi:hypothetical protein